MITKIINKIRAYKINHRKPDKEYKVDENNYGDSKSLVVYTNDYYAWFSSLAYTDSNIIIMLILDNNNDINQYISLFNVIGLRWVNKLDNNNNIILIAGSIVQYETLILELSKMEEFIMEKLLIDSLQYISHNGFDTEFLDKYNIESPDNIIIKSISDDSIHYQYNFNNYGCSIICVDHPDLFLSVDYLSLFTRQELFYLCTIEIVDEDDAYFSINLLDMVNYLIDEDYNGNKIPIDLIGVFNDFQNDNEIDIMQDADIFTYNLLSELKIDTSIYSDLENHQIFNDGLFDNIDEILE